MIRPGADHSNLELASRVPAGIAVDDVQPFAGVQKINGALPVRHEGLVGLPDVYRPPPNSFAAARVVDDALVFWTATSLLAAVGGQRTGRRDQIPLDDAFFIHSGHGQVSKNRCDPNSIIAQMKQLGHRMPRREPLNRSAGSETAHAQRARNYRFTASVRPMSFSPIAITLPIRARHDEQCETNL